MDRRDFLKTATVAAAGSAAPASIQSAQSSGVPGRPESPNMIYRELGARANAFPQSASAAITSGNSKTPTRASIYFVQESIAASLLWITAGTTTAVSARSGWARLSAMVIGKRSS